MVSMSARRGVPHAANFILRECRRVVYGNFVTSDQKQSGDPADGRLIYLGAHTFGRSSLISTAWTQISSMWMFMLITR